MSDLNVEGFGDFLKGLPEKRSTPKQRKMCSDCDKRPICEEQRRNGGSLCEPCLEWAGWENQHNDDCHMELQEGETLILSDEQLTEIRIAMENCPICQNYPHPRDTFKAGHTNTAAKSYTSHAECGHPRTPKDRELCRRARRAAEAKKV